ncbi:MarR family transcriptional regulator [Actinokineospora sp. NBRC 105648]|uniref:MarR family winged helix-turn-helix transcriptional regulator n=1 Tax=Actinokineospora sp. NBRC 105648 TaxID=3032206 RepID=UPI0024A4290A|nr:MarR family transcriptional regulator [Actinokineospora sp. NBRC 105648]GLZ42227.1 putative HTH-type transcriptional regulator YcgE [Actinokineospora sp. NBRC 105648]
MTSPRDAQRVGTDPTEGADGVAGKWQVGSPGVGNPLMERLQEVGALTRVIEKRLSGVLGVNGTGLSAMEHLASEGPLTAKDLADRLRVSTAASTHIVDRLEKAGHIVRRPHATDRRKVLVEPVPESMTRLFEHIDPLLHGVASLVAALSPGDRDAVENFLTEVVRIYADTADSLPRD